MTLTQFTAQQYITKSSTRQANHCSAETTAVFSRPKRYRPAAAANTYILKERSDIGSDEQHPTVGFRHCQRVNSDDRDYTEFRFTGDPSCNALRHLSNNDLSTSAEVTKSNTKLLHFLVNGHRPSDVIQRRGRGESVPKISDAQIDRLADC